MGKSNAARTGFGAKAMMKIVVKCFTLGLAFILTGGTSTCAAQSGSDEKKMAVSIHHVLCDGLGKLALDWVITNTQKEPAYVYATFLRGPTVALDFDAPSHLVTVWTSRPAEATFAVNDYPRPKFVRLRPGAVLRGRFVDYPRRKPPVVGATQLVFAIAFGQSAESVENELREGHYGHPANPIVQWQQIAKSAPVPLHSCTLR